MRRFAQRPARARAAEMARRALLVVMLSAVALAACGSNSASPSTTATGSAGPAASQTPVASEPPAMASSKPVPSPTPGAAASKPVPSPTPGAAASKPVPSPTPGAAASKPVPSPTPGAAASKPVPSADGVRFVACALFSGAELSTLLDIEGVQPTPMPSVGWIAGQCAWNGPTSGFFVSVGTAASIKAVGDAAVPNAKAKLAQFRQLASTIGTPKDVAGIGDGAVLTATGIATYKGNTYLQVTNLGLTEEQLIEIAKLAIARL
jgi:hypothetical protein